jgi:hypothetical protein
MSMGEAAGAAAALAIEKDTKVRDIDLAILRRRLREQGHDPGDLPSANAVPANEDT